MVDNIDDAFKWMKKIDKFEEKHFGLRPEYRVIGELMNRMKVSEGKERFILQQKLNRAMRMVEWKEAFDPNDPENYGVLVHEEVGPNVESVEDKAEAEEDEAPKEKGIDDEEEEYDDMKEKDDKLLAELGAIDKKLEEKLAELEHTFGRRGKLLEEEIRDLAEERNALIDKKRKPLYRKVSAHTILQSLFLFFLF